MLKDIEFSAVAIRICNYHESQHLLASFLLVNCTLLWPARIVYKFNKDRVEGLYQIGKANMSELTQYIGT